MKCKQVNEAESTRELGNMLVLRKRRSKHQYALHGSLGSEIVSRRLLGTGLVGIQGPLG